MSPTGRLAAICLIGMIIPPGISAHPLDALSAAEISATVEILRDNGSIDVGARFPTLTLHENDKASVRSWRFS